MADVQYTIYGYCDASSTGALTSAGANFTYASTCVLFVDVGIDASIVFRCSTGARSVSEQASTDRVRSSSCCLMYDEVSYATYPTYPMSSMPTRYMVILSRYTSRKGRIFMLPAPLRVPL